MSSVRDMPVVTQVRAVSSVEFARTVLALYAEGTPLTCVPDGGTAPGLRLGETRTPATGGGWVDTGSWSMPATDDLAQVTYTSGTEGQRKGILLTSRMLSDVHERLVDVMQLDASVREYVGIPTYYSFGLGRLRACAAVGGQAFIPEHGFNAIEAATMLEDGAINSISAVPSIWRMVLAARHLFEKGAERLRWIEIGSQYMSADEKRALRTLFPAARIVQHYGLTEASRTTFLDISACHDAALESVGRPTGDADVAIADDGRIRIRGPHVATHALRDGALTRLTDDGWLTTSDAGRLDGDLVFYEGRVDFMINCGGKKVGPDALEAAVLERVGQDVPLAVGRTDHPMLGDGFVVVLADGAAGGTADGTGVEADAVRAATIDVLRSEFQIEGEQCVDVRTMPELPRTETGKIQRRTLQDRLEAGAAEIPASASTASPFAAAGGGGGGGSGGAIPDGAIASPDDPGLQGQLVRIWQSTLHARSISLDTTFYDHGGDSLSSIGLLLAIERAGLDRSIATRILDGETIRSIVADPSGRGAVGATAARIGADAINATRGLFVLLLVAIHFVPGIIARLGLSQAQADRLDVLLNPFYRFGTPSFAMAFGLGVGYFMFPQFARGDTRMWPRILRSVGIVTIGIAILAGMSAILYEPREGGVSIVVATLYSVLLYYFLALLSLGLWHAVLRRVTPLWVGALLAVAGFLAAHFVVGSFVTSRILDNGFLDLARHMTVAKYNYFYMSAMVMFGVAVGDHLQRSGDGWRSLRSTYPMLGVATIAIAYAALYDLDAATRWFEPGLPTVPALTVYGGIVLLVLGLALIAASVGRDTPCIRWPMAMFGAAGVLSLPFYVGHALVIPAKDLLEGAGVPGVVALGASLGTFLLVAAFLVRRVMRIF